MNGIGPINFQVEMLNIGGAMNLTSGRFTAPRNGIYYFAFNGMAEFTSFDNSYIRIGLSTSYNVVLGTAYVSGSIADIGDRKYSNPSIEVTTYLRAGDQVFLNIEVNWYARLYEGGYNTYYNQFSGWQLQEDLPLS